MRRRGFSLVELLVVIAIISVIFSMLLPAVQKVRESGNRLRCTNNLHQLGIAMHAYHDANATLPSGSYSVTGYFSLHGVLLPFIEETSLYNRFDFTNTPIITAGPPSPNDTPSKEVVKVFLCPSDTTQGGYYGYTNYHTNHGSWVGVTAKWDGVFGPAYAIDYWGQTVPGGIATPMRLDYIRDGASNTCALAEVANGLGATASPASKYDVYDSGAISTASLLAARSDLLAKNWKTASLIPFGSGTWRMRGSPWSEGTVWRNGYNHLLPPNNPAWRISGEWYKIVSPASSYHSGGSVVVAMCDGSVRSVSERVDSDVWLAAGTREGGETVGSLP